MERLLNALRYGDWETRKCIGSVILFILLGIGLIIAAGLSGHFFLFVLGMLSGAVALMISQSFDLVDEDFVAEIDSKGTKDTVHSVTVRKDGIVFKNSDVFKQEEEAKKEAALKEEEAKKKAALLEEEKLLQEEIKKEAKVHKAKEKKEKSKKVKEKKERARKEKQRKEKAEKEPKVKERRAKERAVKAPRIKEEKITDKTEKLPKVKEKKIRERIAKEILEEENEPKIKEKKSKKKPEVEENKAEEKIENKTSEKKSAELPPQESIESNQVEIEDDITAAEEQAAVFESYDKQVLVQVKRKYRVKKDHRPILIDNSKAYNIKECPAFIWRVHNKVYLLLLEKEPRKITLSRETIKHVGYAPHVRGNRSLEYRAFEKDNLITAVFKDFLPDYYTYKTERGSYRAKNLYYIHPDIQITSRSISQVMDLLYLNFMPSDRITRSEDFNGFFKRIYAANLMFNDKAYTITEYKNVVERVLEELCVTEMSEREFNNTLENLVKARFISQEYADHYYRVRSKAKG